MQETPHLISSLLCSRLCHELIGPLGALINGFDMYREFGDDFTADEHAVLHQSCDRLELRIKFYRLAYGFAGHRLYAPQEFIPLLHSILDEHRIALTLPDESVFHDLPEGGLWLLMNLGALGVDIVKSDGEVICRMSAGDIGSLAVDYRGANVALDARFAEALTGAIAPEALTAYNVHALHTHQIAQGLGLGLTVNQTPQQIALSLRKS